MNSGKKSSHWYFLLVTVILGFWQVAFFQHSLKWDVIDVVFPFRYYFSECIQAGYFPFWNPYLQTGTPFYADLQAPTFYPELLFTSLFSGYGIYTMNFLFVVYVFIAAAGMYKLSFYFNKNRLASFFAGIAYAFSGYIIGHGQHFFLLVGAAWIPFVIVNYLKLNRERNFVQALKTAVFIFLMVTGAYQALSFTLFYLLLFLFFYFLIGAISQKRYGEIAGILKINLLLFLIVVTSTLPLIFTAFEILTSVERLAEGVNLNQSLSHSQSIKSFTSFILPFSTIQQTGFFGNVDISMRNHYFGLIPVLFFLAALFQKRSGVEYLILIFGFIIFASSFNFLSVRDFMFMHVPFMNLFKYAAYIRIFGLLAFIMISANYLDYFQKNAGKEKPKIVGLIIVFMLVLLFLMLFYFFKISANDFENLLQQNNLRDLVNNLSFAQSILFQAIFQFLVCTAFLLIIVFYNKIRYPLQWLVILFVAEIFTASQLNMNSTVTDSAQRPYRMKKDLALFPDKFPIPVDCKIIYNDQKHVLFPPFWRNTYIFTKQISFGAFSSFELDSFNQLDDDFLNLRDAVLNNHLFYFSDTVFSIKQFADSLIDIEESAQHLYFSQDDFAALSQKTVATDSADQIRVLEFSPNEVVVETSTKNDQFLTMLQTNFRGWNAFIDNQKTPIYTSNFNYRTVFLPAGNHIVRYRYTNNKILLLYIISNVIFYLIILYLAGFYLRKKSNGKAFIIIPLLLFLITGFYVFKRLSYNDQNLTVYQTNNKKWSDKKSLFSFRQDFENEPQKSDSLTSHTRKRNLIIKPADEYFVLCDIPVTTKKMKKGTVVVSVQVLPETYVEGLIVSDVSDQKDSNKWHATKIERQIEEPGQWNEIIYLRNFYDLDEGDVINFYVWNLNHSQFRIDNIKVDFYPL